MIIRNVVPPIILALMPCAPMEPLQLKQADAVEAAIEDELIALRVGPFL